MVKGSRYKPDSHRGHSNWQARWVLLLRWSYGGQVDTGIPGLLDCWSVLSWIR